MPSQGLKDEKLRELAALAEGYGSFLAGEAYGLQGPGLDVDLATMEDLAVTMQRALLKGICETLTRRQAERLPDTLPCPDCGRECPVELPPDTPDQPADRQAGKGGTRTMQTRGGGFGLAEPCCTCRPCRRSFFPAADGAADRRTRL